MASYQDLLDAIARVGAATGDNRAWMAGLSDADLTLVTSPVNVIAPNAIDNVVAKIRAQHRQVFEPAAPAVAEGRAAEAIRTAETSLALQNSVSAHLDLQVITAVLNAHATHAAGREALDGLQDEIETAVATRTDLDTPAGARAFQRYLIGKLRDIKEVVETAGLDDTSKASLAAALASLYGGASQDAGEPAPEPKPTAEAAAPPAQQPPPAATPAAMPADPLDGALLPEDLVALPPDPSTAGQPMAAPMMPPTAAIPAPSGGSGALPAGPSPMPPSLDNLASPRLPREDSMFDDPLLDEPFEEGTDDPAAEDVDAAGEDPTGPAAEDPTVVQLPNGETVTAASPQLAAAISAAVAGTPIPEAFRQQGITIPAPGTPVPHAIEAARVIPGDIGILTDRHALALGNGKAVFNNQIQPIASVTGPSFLGWEHPPEPGDRKTTPKTDQPTPTRPAVTAGPPIGE